jgi:hypothetical protein
MAWGAQLRGFDNLSPEMMAAAREGTQAGLEDLGIKGTDMVQQNIETPFDGKPAAVCFGNLDGSITSDFQWMGDAAHEIIGVSPQLGADKYAAPVETGAVPHMPPPSALLPWVQKKFDVDNEKEALSTAFAVAMSIKKRGTQGHEMFSRGLEQLEPLAPPALEHEIALAFARHGFVPLGGLA